ncbi:MAG: SDR family oxidoreductase [Bdellovibrio sp.]|nr:MAG: SDR family oxidoreductase [Bdellovibrio sp.]
MLSDKSVIITGGGRGIGKAIALECAKHHANVIILARTQSQINDTLSEIHEKTGQDAQGYSVDVSSYSALKDFYEKVKHQNIFGVVCAAAIHGPIGPLETTDVKDWTHAIEVNLFGTMYMVHLFTPLMKKRKEGRFILFSGGGQGAFENFSAYVSSKGAIWRFCETVAKELAPFNIYMNAIAPGAVNTALLDNVFKVGKEKVGEEYFQKSIQQKESGGIPVHIPAKAALYLLSDQSKGLYGKTISAVWDKYQDFKDLKKISESSIFTYKRVVDFDGGTQPKD